MGITLLLLLLSHFRCVRLCATPEAAAHQAPPSMGFCRQEYWSGVPLPLLVYNKTMVNILHGVTIVSPSQLEIPSYIGSQELSFNPSLPNLCTCKRDIYMLICTISYLSILYVCLCCAQSHLSLCDPMAVAHQAPLSMGFPNQ